MMNTLIEPGSVVDRVVIWKGEGLSEDNGREEIMCHLIFFNGKEVEFLLDRSELENEKYNDGIYEYKNGEYIQIENHGRINY